ncbi:DEAD/DEAH box helicase [Janthinobacterium agaricidamnosum]|uniref:DEAD/DEAH box helicase n=1 Tax=Janthinobacterium agaricidamnosum TaxID=55508 RepID=UPI00056F88D5|nr:3'-5' exonuclease [Janthinobacterium agaricidamnosum]
MATLIPGIHSCLSRMMPGEKRFAYRLEEKLGAEYLCWYDVSIGDKTRHPDFIVFHPVCGLLVLEVKDWKLDTIQTIDKNHVTLAVDGALKSVQNPLEQARDFMFKVTNKLERDPTLILQNGTSKGKPIFPYGHGVVLSNISRKQFDDAGMGDILPPHLVICQNEMTESADAAVFEQRLVDMMPVKSRSRLSEAQMDRVRWHIFPEVRIPMQQDLFSESGQVMTEIPDILRVMDLQQEQLARSLGDGHRVIHGVAGSGKTLILAYRAEYLAKICQRPILILCYNKMLVSKLADSIKAKGLQEKVHVLTFHAWCSQKLSAYQANRPEKPANSWDSKAWEQYFDGCVDSTIDAVDQGVIPSAQYDAILIDEGHDFKPEWFKLVVKMIHPESNSLLVLYDDAQSIYNGPKKLRFSFSSVGVKAQGRTTILKLNYRNTAEILSVARAFADDLLSPNDTEEDQAPTVQPISTGRRGPKPILRKLPSLSDEAGYLAQVLSEENRAGVPWNEMAILCRRYAVGQDLAGVLKSKGIPFQSQLDKKSAYSSTHNSVKLMTLHSSKGLEFPLVCIPGMGTLAASDDVQDEVRLLYVAMTRATQQLVMTHGDASVLADKMQKAMAVLHGL